MFSFILLFLHQFQLLLPTTTEREYYGLIFIIIHFIQINTESLPATNSSQFCTGNSVMEMEAILAFEVAALYRWIVQ